MKLLEALKIVREHARKSPFSGEPECRKAFKVVDAKIEALEAKESWRKSISHEPPTVQPDITPPSFIHPFVNALDTTDNTKQP